MKPLFVLGVGAQKSGTSWLHKTLSNQDNVNLGFTKEYHIWDYIFSDLCKEFKAPLNKTDDAGAAMRRLMQKDPEIYAKYFQSLITSNVSVTGDITPSYCLINEYGLEKISSIVKDAGFDIKVIFLMRDPVERIWSAVRMNKRGRLRRGQNLPKNYCDSLVREYLNIKARVARSDYKTTVQNVTKVFTEEEVYFGFYESLFTPKSIDMLQDFLGFNIDNVDFLERVNSSEPELISEETLKLLRDFLAPQYDFCNDRFTGVKDLWRYFG